MTVQIVQLYIYFKTFYCKGIHEIRMPTVNCTTADKTLTNELGLLTGNRYEITSE